ncbi:MaoC/PaaZ C-terminal domain-containing protein [Nocardioides jishulii]|uniref:MaoC-like domain-containing protein n=1 Tax=Nocardioides jishulii TaxID=2575440 RepID=A0A4U2YRV9_9ACTN|nr:MaoC/PaaZ C-terminal domain-containing protein [Nocardioides jishulii]QCX26510.1 hypothetical protein FCL41_02325 [Nocardioides jishulii]TKI63684.1 hypothetical protein FC770_00380 [Nocardioides jishulii]
MPSRLPVEPGLVHLLARAVGDEAAARDALATAPGQAATLPLTWTRAMAEHFDDADELRAWPGGAPTPVGGSTGQLHAEQHFELLRPVPMGTTLSVRTEAGRTWHREGRSGALEFAELVTDFVDDHGEVLVRSRKVGVRRGPPAAGPPAASPAPPRHEPATPPPTEQREHPALRPGARDLWGWGVGDAHTACLTPVLTRADVARYAGVTGDVNLVHVDDTVALRAGHPRVLAHGMLTMGLTASHLTALVGHHRVRRFGGRFAAPVLVDDRLDCTVGLARLDDEVSPWVDLTVETRRGDGTAVFLGAAQVDRPGP